MRFKDYISALKPYILDGRIMIPEDSEISGATCDSRLVKPGWLFCGIKGAVSDGAAYIEQAIGNGAKVIVTDSPLEVVPGGISCIRVNHGRHAIARVAQVAAGFPANHLRLWAVTGTNGKTTTAFLLKKMLMHGRYRAGMIGTVVYDDGNREISADRTTPTPFDLQELWKNMVKNGVSDCVMEVSSHAIEQERMGDCRFSGAIFTNLTQDHLDYHVTMENYFACKCRLFTEMLLPGAVAIINTDDEYGRRLYDMLLPRQASGNLTVIGFGCHETSQVRMEQIELLDGKFSICQSGKLERYDISMVGLYNVYNAVGALLLGKHIGLPSVRAAIADFDGAPGRLQKITTKKGTKAFVDYAHTDDAISKALGALRQVCKGRLIIVFGCGGDRDRTKRPKMGHAACNADVLFVTSDNPRSENPEDIIMEILPGILPGTEYYCIADRRQAISKAVELASADDIILVAGKGHEDYQEINGRKIHFSDMEILLEYC